MESKKINQLATELAPDLSDLTIIGDPTTGISKKITLSQMASLFTGTVEEYANLAAFPLVGVADTIYIALDTNVLYRWNTGTSAYVELSPNIINSLVFSDANGFDGNISLVGSVATLTITTALTTGSVGFIGASGALLQDNANFFWDDTNNRLGLGTNAPTTALDVFGSGIIGRINGTSTNNAYLGFSSAGTNKWSIGNVQSDHRFRIYNEATTSELVSVLSTGEFGIGIANPTTKFHIDGAASALIANLDANVSVAKSISFRSDNSNRFNIEVSGTESGSDAGANLFIRRYSDAGSLIDTPLTITRSTGAITLASALNGTNAIFSSSITATAFIPTGSSVPTNGIYLSAANTLNFATNSTNRLSISSTGVFTLTGALIAPSGEFNGDIIVNGWIRPNNIYAFTADAGTTYIQQPSGGNIVLRKSDATAFLTIANTGLTTFSAFGTHSFSSGGTGYNKLGIRNTTAGAANGAQLSIGTNADPDQFYVQSFATNFTTSGMNIAGGAVINGEGPGGLNIAATQSNIGFYTNGAGAANLRMLISSAGGVQINGASGFGALDVGGQLNATTQNVCRLGNISGVNNGLIIQVNSSNNYIYSFGTLGTGTVTATSGVLSATSDMNLKVEDGYIDNALEKVMNLKPRYFYWKEETGLPIDLRQLGFYAQEVNIALGEEAANTPKEENDKWGIYDRGIVAFLTKAIQEQQAQIEELKALINK